MDIEKQFKDIHERYGNNDISRRSFLKAVKLMGIAAGVVGTSSPLLARYAHAAGQVQFDAYGGVSQAAFRKHVFKPFTAKTGIVVGEGTYRNGEEIFARVLVDEPNTHNFIWTTQVVTPLRIRVQGYGAEIDESKVPRLSSLIKKYVDYHRDVYGNGVMLSVPTSIGGSTLAYNPEKITKAEIDALGYKIMIDPKYKGFVTGDQGYTSRIWIAALQTGQNPNNIGDMKAIWDAIRQSKANVLKYWSSGAEVIKLWSSGDAVVGDVWYAPYNALKADKQPIEQYNAPAGMYFNPGGVCVLKGSPMDAYYEMMDIMLRPEVMIPWSIEAGQMTAMDPTKHPFPAELQAIPGYDPTGKHENYMAFDARYWSDKSEEFAKEFRRVMAG